MPPGTTARVIQSTKAKASVGTTTSSSTTQGGGGASAKRKKRKSREGNQSTTKKRSSTASSASAVGERRESRRVSTEAAHNKSKRSSSGNGRSRRSSSSRPSRRSHRSSSERRLQQIVYEEARRREYEENQNQNPDCCNDCIKVAVKVVHIIDIAAGLTLLIYGFVVSGQHNAPSKAVAILISYGIIYVMTSTLGIIGFNTTHCQRYGLIISAYGGIMIGCMEFISIICVAAMKDDFFQYLHDNRKSLLMSEQTVHNLEKSFGVFVCIALFCAVIEVCRFFMLRPLQESLLQSDIDDVETTKKHQQRSSHIVSRDSTEELNQLLTELAEPLLSQQQQVPSSERKSSKTGVIGSSKGKQGGKRPSPHDFNTSSYTNIGCKTGSVRSMSLQPAPTNPQTFGLPSSTTVVAATAAAARATSLPLTSTRSSGNWFTRSLGLGGGGAAVAVAAANVQDNINDDDDEEYHTHAATVVSSPDEFAPVDETISTEDLWWSHTERDEKMDMSWLEDVDERRLRRGRGGGRDGRRPNSSWSPQSDAENATLKPKVHFGDV